MTTTIFSGDTVRVRVTFKDYSDALTDPDGQIATFTVYDSDENSVFTATATRESTGVYHYDWTAPELEGNYFIEFLGDFVAKPQLSRVKYRIKFKPVSQ